MTPQNNNIQWIINFSHLLQNDNKLKKIDNKEGEMYGACVRVVRVLSSEPKPDDVGGGVGEAVGEGRLVDPF
jgi:hypothetical protein